MNYTSSSKQVTHWIAACIVGILTSHLRGDTVIDAFEAAPERWGAGLQLDTEHHKEGQASLCWPADKRARIALQDIPADWSMFKALSFWCYSEKDTGNRIIMAFYSENPDSEGGDYFIHTFTVDWTGWKMFELPLAKMGVARKPFGWEKISGIAFHSRGWGQDETIPGTVLFLDDLKLVERTAAEREQIRKEQEALRDGLLIPISDCEDLLEYYAPDRAVAIDFWKPQPGSDDGGVDLRRDWHGLTVVCPDSKKTCGLRRSYNLDLAPYSALLVQARTRPGARLRVVLEGDGGRVLGQMEQEGTGVPDVFSIVLEGGILKAVGVELTAAKGAAEGSPVPASTLEWIKLRHPEQPTLDAFSNLTCAVVFRPVRPTWGASTYRLLRSRKPIVASPADGVRTIADAVPAGTPVLFDFPPEQGEWHYALAPVTAGAAQRPGPDVTVDVDAAAPPVIGRLTEPAVIDGDLTEWSAAAQQSLVVARGPESHVNGDIPESTADLSGTAIFAHDDARFYVGVSVTDDVVRHDNPHPWQGDGVVVMLRFSPPDADKTLGRYDLVLNCTAAADARILEDRDHAYPADAKPKAPGTWAVKRTATGYTVEGSVPLATLCSHGFTPASGGLGLGLVLFDADQTAGPTQRQTVTSWNQRKKTYAPGEAALVKWR